MNKLKAMFFHRRSNRNSSSERDNSNNSSRSIASGNEVQNFPYHYLLKLQLSRIQPPLKGDFGMNEHCTFSHNGIPFTFDLSGDCHTFMVWSLTHTISGKDKEEVLLAKYLELEQELVDIRLEWNDDGEIILYQNLPIFLVQEDCLGEFQEVLSRFMSERSNVSAALRRVSCPDRTFAKKSIGQKSLSLRNVFAGRSA
jgi:hypothetical protein